MSASTVIYMAAPSPAPTEVITRNGNVYNPDPDGGIIGAYAIDVPDLLAAGFTLLSGGADQRNNLAAAADPTADDDSGENYGIGSIWINTTGDRTWVCVDATATAAIWVQTGGKTAAVTAAGSSTSDAAALVGQTNVVAGADGTKGVKLPTGVAGMKICVVNNAASALKVYPDAGGQINAGGANTAFVMAAGRVSTFVCSAALTWEVDTMDAYGALVAGVAAGYKIARGVHQQAAASDTVVTGLATVVAVVASWRDAPTLKQMFVTASIGDQAGSPAAGSILINTYKPTASGDVTPTAATDFSDNLSINWIAIGT